MRHVLLASTCLIAVASDASAESTISTTVTGPVRTSTVKSGSPDDILINSTGIVNGGVIIDSNHKLNNKGTIQIPNQSGAIGIDASAGVTSTINHEGKIIIDEPFTPTDSDNDGDLDGPFATGSSRVGIRTNGVFNGNIVIGSSGTVTVEGNDSAGIHLGGPLNGSFAHDGSTSVLGSRTVGIHLSDVSGNTRIAGTIAARGEGAVAVRSSGAIQGALVIQGAVAASGYRYTASPTDSSKLDSDDLLQGGPAISIEGSVSKGIVLAVPPKDQSASDKDEDDDGIEDAKEGIASVTSFGAAPALRIGSANAISVGAVENSGTGFGLIIDGAVLGDAVYKGVNATGLQIGGLGGTVSIANGIGISGGVGAKSVDGAASAVRLAAGATTGELRNSGKMIAASGNSATSAATTLHIATGANVPVVRNSGEILASTGENGSAAAIADRSGTLALVENSGTIAATGAKAASGRNVAIDLSANDAGATIKQTAVAANFAPPAIKGDIHFGNGNDNFDVADGQLAGDVSFGTGNNRFTLAGDATAAGKLVFGGGADLLATSGTSMFNGFVDFGGGSDSLTIGGNSTFNAQLANSTSLSVNLQKGTFGVIKSASIASLSVSDGGVLAVTLATTPGASSVLNVSGAATFASGSKLQLNVADVAQAEGHFVVVNAGSLAGGSNIAANSEMLPFLYKGSLSVSGNQVAVDINRKTATELGLNQSEGGAYSAIYDALGSDEDIGDAFLTIRTQQDFVGTLRQMLPDHAGGTFEAVTLGDRVIARALTDAAAPYKDAGGVSYLFTQVAWGSSKSIGETAGYKIGGWGAAGGAELTTRLGKFGAALSYLWGKDDDDATDNSVNANQYSLAAHWRVQKKGLQLVARGSYAYVTFRGDRFFRFGAGQDAIDRKMEGEWNGSLFSGSARASQELWAGSFFIRPAAGLEYHRLAEDGYQESGGGSSLDLNVAKRTSDELAINALLAAGLELGGVRGDEGYFRVEAEFGRRHIAGGELGVTRASFADGELFTLKPEARESGWVGRLRGIGGGFGYKFAGEVGAEQREDKVAASARATLTLGF